MNQVGFSCFFGSGFSDCLSAVLKASVADLPSRIWGAGRGAFTTFFGFGMEKSYIDSAPESQYQYATEPNEAGFSSLACDAPYLARSVVQTVTWLAR